MIIFGAGVIGEATFRACRSKGMEVDFFLDDRINGSLCGRPIITTAQLPENRSTRFYLTSPNIDDMVKPLEKRGYRNWKSCGEVLHDFDLSHMTHPEYSVEHIKYLVRTCLHHHDNYLHPERLTVQSIDLIVTERCSMKCKDCSNLMQYYESPENADLNEMLQTIDSIHEKMDEIYEVRVIGGEPFMNKEVHLVVEKLTSKEKIKKVAIFTNATILPKDHQWPAFQHEKVRFFITEYLQSRKLQPLIEELEKRGIAYVSEKANNWTECSPLEKHNRSVSEQEAVFEACCAKNLATLADGRLYRCPFAANAFKLGAVPDYEEDYLDVSRAGRGEIRGFLRDKPYIETCDHCNGRSYGDKTIEPAIQVKTPLKYKRYELKVGT